MSDYIVTSYRNGEAFAWDRVRTMEELVEVVNLAFPTLAEREQRLGLSCAGSIRVERTISFHDIPMIMDERVRENEPIMVRDLPSLRGRR